MDTPPDEGLDEGRARWQEAYDSSTLRDTDFETMSGIGLEPVYGPGDWPEDRVAPRLGWPGRPPYTRGPHASMYRSKLWTMRLFAGFGTAEDTNVRFRELLRAGSGGLSVAFDLPTLMGRDSDDPLTEGEVGRCGVAVDTLADAEDLFAGIDLGSVTTSMTINSPAPILMAMYVGAAEDAGVARRDLGGTLQNDILKEYQAQKEYIFPPRPSMRLVVDVVRFCAAEMPKFHPVSVSGYHIREAGATAAQELAFTLANGFAYVEAVLAAGLRRRRVRAPAELLLQRPSRLLRGDRQVPRRAPHLGALDGRPVRSDVPPVAASSGSTPRLRASRSRPSNPR